MKPDVFLGIDWGGTRIKLGALSSNGQLLATDVYCCPKAGCIETVVEGLLGRTAEFRDRVGGTLRGIGLGLTGPVNPDFGVVYLPGKIQGLQDFPIVQRFREFFSVPVTADNDGTCALYAERAFGAARDVDWAAVITLGTGVGSAVLADGRILRDPYFLFGNQIGHFVIQTGDEPLCLTGARGTAEMFCSATALALAVRGGLQRGIPSTLSERYFSDPFSVDFRAVIEEGVEKGDPLCVDELRRWSQKLGWLIVTAIHAYSSQKVILAGGATLGSQHFLPQVQALVDSHTFRYPPDRHVPVVVSKIHENAGVLGAAEMARARLTDSLATTHHD